MKHSLALVLICIGTSPMIYASDENDVMAKLKSLIISASTENIPTPVFHYIKVNIWKPYDGSHQTQPELTAAIPFTTTDTLAHVQTRMEELSGKKVSLRLSYLSLDTKVEDSMYYSPYKKFFEQIALDAHIIEK